MTFPFFFFLLHNDAVDEKRRGKEKFLFKVHFKLQQYERWSKRKEEELRDNHKNFLQTSEQTAGKVFFFDFDRESERDEEVGQKCQWREKSLLENRKMYHAYFTTNP